MALARLQKKSLSKLACSEQGFGSGSFPMSNPRVVKARAQRKVWSHPKNEQGGGSSRWQSMAARDPEMLPSPSSSCHTLLLVQDRTLRLGLDHSGRSGAAVFFMCNHWKASPVPCLSPGVRCYSQKKENWFFSKIFFYLTMVFLMPKFPKGIATVSITFYL